MLRVLLIANYALIALLMRISDESNQQPEPIQFEVPAWSMTEGDAVIGAGGL